MARYGTFTFRVDKNERQMLVILAEHLPRSQSDAMRLLIRKAVKGLESETAVSVHPQLKGIDNDSAND